MAIQKMDPEAKRAWVEALRSGEYKQGCDVLALVSRDGRAAFCCMGVLCDVAGLPSDHNEDLGTLRYEFDGESCAAALPGSFASAIGLQRYPVLTYNGQARTASQLNDDERLSFDEIADLIDAQL